MKEIYITVNGVGMTKEEYKSYRASKDDVQNKKKVKAKKQVKEISAVAIEIENMLKQMGTLKSVQVYKNHAYRSWGTIANEILAYHGIRKPMAEFCVRFGELNCLLEEIQKMARRNEKAAYQYVDKMAWKLDDMKTNITQIMSAVNESDVCKRFKNHEAINGKGRQLGLATIVEKCYGTISKIEETIKELRRIADEGTDPFAVGDHMSARTRARCWA